MALWTVLILLDSEWLTNDDTAINGEPLSSGFHTTCFHQDTAQLRLMHPVTGH